MLIDHRRQTLKAIDQDSTLGIDWQSIDDDCYIKIERRLIY